MIRYGGLLESMGGSRKRSKDGWPKREAPSSVAINSKSLRLRLGNPRPLLIWPLRPPKPPKPEEPKSLPPNENVDENMTRTLATDDWKHLLRRGFLIRKLRLLNVNAEIRWKAKWEGRKKSGNIDQVQRYHGCWNQIRFITPHLLGTFDSSQHNTVRVGY